VKNKFIINFLLIFFIISSQSYAQSIAYANLDKIIKSSDVGKKIILFFENENEKLNKQISLEEKSLIDKEKSLINKKNILSNEEFEKNVNSIKKDISIFKQNRQNKIIALNNRKDKISNMLLTEINLILRDFAEKNKIDMIISSNQMLIGKSSLDVTENILKEVNNKIKNFDIK